jgi:hypothetical protein
MTKLLSMTLSFIKRSSLATGQWSDIRSGYQMVKTKWLTIQYLDKMSEYQMVTRLDHFKQKNVIKIFFNNKTVYFSNHLLSGLVIEW